MSHPSRTRVKICGITTPAAACSAAWAGADAIGLVFHAPSPRAVNVDVARAITQALPPFVASVGLFVNAAPAVVREVLAEVPLDLLQFHGDETPEYCASFGKPWLKAIRVRPDTYIPALLEAYRDARGILLDAWHQDVYGGSGRSFDWDLVSRQHPERAPAGPPLILAGGLTRDNVAQAIRTVQPWGVDVSSGVESAPGVKSDSLINAFMHAVHAGAMQVREVQGV